MTYSFEHYVFFTDRKSHSLITRKTARNDNEYLDLMDNTDPDIWELITDPDTIEKLKAIY